MGLLCYFQQYCSHIVGPGLINKLFVYPKRPTRKKKVPTQIIFSKTILYFFLITGYFHKFHNDMVSYSKW